MLLLKKTLKPIGIGSILRLTPKTIDIYNSKKMSAEPLRGNAWIVVGILNSSKQRMFRLEKLFLYSTKEDNTKVFTSKSPFLIDFSIISESRLIEHSSYIDIFGERGKIQVMNYLNKKHGITFKRL